MLEVRHLNASYGQAQVLFDVSLSVPLGSMVLIQGLNGAGKSTLLKSIMGLMNNVTGNVNWQGRALENLPPYARSQMGLGYVPEDRRLFAALTVRQKFRDCSAGAQSSTIASFDHSPSTARCLGVVSHTWRDARSASVPNEWWRTANVGTGSNLDDTSQRALVGRTMRRHCPGFGSIDSEGAGKTQEPRIHALNC